MKLSVGVIITDGVSVLLGHATNKTWWDIPKGEMESGEGTFETALRELKEETGVVIKYPLHQLEYLGITAYIPNKKNICLYRYLTTELPDTNMMKCTSTFDYNGVAMPELDEFKYVKCLDIFNYVTPNLFRILEPIICFGNCNLHRYL